MLWLPALGLTVRERASRFLVRHCPPYVYLGLPYVTAHDQISQAFPLHSCTGLEVGVAWDWGHYFASILWMEITQVLCALVGVSQWLWQQHECIIYMITLKRLVQAQGYIGSAIAWLCVRNFFMVSKNQMLMLMHQYDNKGYITLGKTLLH